MAVKGGKPSPLPIIFFTPDPATDVSEGIHEPGPATYPRSPTQSTRSFEQENGNDVDITTFPVTTDSSNVDDSVAPRSKQLLQLPTAELINPSFSSIDSDTAVVLPTVSHTQVQVRRGFFGKALQFCTRHFALIATMCVLVANSPSCILLWTLQEYTGKDAVAQMLPHCVPPIVMSSVVLIWAAKVAKSTRGTQAAKARGSTYLLLTLVGAALALVLTIPANVLAINMLLRPETGEQVLRAVWDGVICMLCIFLRNWGVRLMLLAYAARQRLIFLIFNRPFEMRQWGDTRWQARAHVFGSIVGVAIIEFVVMLVLLVLYVLGRVDWVAYLGVDRASSLYYIGCVAWYTWRTRSTCPGMFNDRWANLYATLVAAVLLLAPLPVQLTNNSLVPGAPVALTALLCYPTCVTISSILLITTFSSVQQMAGASRPTEGSMMPHNHIERFSLSVLPPESNETASVDYSVTAENQLYVGSYRRIFSGTLAWVRIAGAVNKRQLQWEMV